MTLPNLPIGIQSFSELRTRNMLYVDKTQPIQRLLSTGKYYFLSRPRRFGKSLTLSTIRAIYEGKRELFQGLWIEDQWDWTQVHPVIHLSINLLDYQGSGLENALIAALQTCAADYRITISGHTAKSLFAHLIKTLFDHHGKVVVLIDEYDKPLIDYLDDIPQAKINQTVMKNFYSVVKDSDPYLQFLLITGVSKFSKVSIFSDLNHLFDLTFAREAVALTGYTQAELEQYFTPYMPEVEANLGIDHATLLEKMREWYNGYSWDGQTRVYNPFSILNFFRAGDFRNFWFETGTPTFLLTLLREQNLYKLDSLTVHERTFSSYDIEYLQAIPILFQTGYLTIKAKQAFGLYTLDYPNSEVRESLLDYIISDLRHLHAPMSSPMVVDLHHAFAANDLERVMTLVKSIFKTIPSQIFIKEAESYYHSLIYLVFFYLGQYTESEVNTNDGRLDCVVKTPTHIYVLEFKLNKSAEKALQQIKDKAYAEKYRADPRQKVLVGVNFSSALKTVDGWVSEVLV
jgi:hypothetical protein